VGGHFFPCLVCKWGDLIIAKGCGIMLVHVKQWPLGETQTQFKFQLFLYVSRFSFRYQEVIWTASAC
jgi:hypothetical protein